MSVERKIWFRRKRSGWGWTPVTGEGWAVVLAYIVLILGMGALVQKGSAVYYGGIAVLTALLIAIGYLKGETPRWQWGDKQG